MQEVYIEEKVGSCGETSAGDVQVWDRDIGDSFDYNGIPPERVGGVLGHWVSRIFVEFVLSSGGFLLEK